MGVFDYFKAVVGGYVGNMQFMERPGEFLPVPQDLLGTCGTFGGRWPSVRARRPARY